MASKFNYNQFVRDTMKSMPEADMAEVVSIFVDKMGIAEARARAYYRWGVVKEGLPGKLEAKPRAAKKAKAIKVSPQKFPRVLVTDKPKVTDKTVEELNDIKAKNLARLKAVHAKYQKKTPAPTSEEYREPDSFDAPASLTADQVRALV